MKTDAVEPAQDRREDLNFKVTAQFRRAFRLVAADLDMKHAELFQAMFMGFVEANRDRISVTIDPSLLRGDELQ